jgi:hypothetical protein
MAQLVLEGADDLTAIFEGLSVRDRYLEGKLGDGHCWRIVPGNPKTLAELSIQSMKDIRIQAVERKMPDRQSLDEQPITERQTSRNREERRLRFIIEGIQ